MTTEICEGCDGSGVRVPASPSCTFKRNPIPEGWVVLERCDTCQRYSDDLAAGQAHYTEARPIVCNSGGEHVIVDPKSKKEGP